MTSPLWASVSSVEAASQGRARLVLPGTPGAGGPGSLGGDPTTHKRTWGPAQGSCPMDLTFLQEGFGWTNGAALMLLDRYGDRLSSGAQTALLAPHCLAAALLLSLLPQ